MAVVVRNGCKQFGASVVLEDLNLTVRQGTIYGLLGASGCGKTTALSCVVGLKSLDSGDIMVFGARPGTRGSGIPGPGVGYMPQDIALYPLFKIKELLAYYGKVYGMNTNDIKKRTQFLADFLQLPDLSKRIETLSGGQLRRVSFAVAMIHQPPLLILDEPTVGLDPLLRESIWNHLSELVKKDEKTTIIITTHYIEEARFCDTVGVMRRGRVLVEQNPQALLAHYNSTSLESVVLQLCKQDDEYAKAELKQKQGFCNGNFQPIISQQVPKFPSTINTHQIPTSEDEFTGVELKKIRRLSGNNNVNDMKWNGTSWKGGCTREPAKTSPLKLLKSHWDITCSVAKKNCIVHIRHPVAVAAQVFLPLLQTVLYNLVVGTEPVGQKVSFVSNDWNNLNFRKNIDSPFFNDTLDQYCTKNFRGTKFPPNGTLLDESQCFSDELSAICTFFNTFKGHHVEWIEKPSLEESLQSVLLGDSAAYLEIPDNFTYHLKNRFFYRQFADNDTLAGSSLKVRMDMSDALSRAWLTQTVLRNFYQFMGEMVSSCGQEPRLVELPIKFNAIYGELDGQNWIQFIQPALIIIFMFILANLPGTIWVMEKRLGIADRGAVAGIRTGHIVAASFISDSLIAFGQMGIFFFVLPSFYGMKSEGSWILMITLVFLDYLAGLSLGLLWGSMFNHEMDIIMINMFISSMLTISSGGIWPIESVVPWYRVFCFCLPVTLPVISMRSIMFRGWGLEHPAVLHGFLVSITFTILCLALIALISSRKK